MAWTEVGQRDKSRCCSRQEGWKREDFKLSELRKKWEKSVWGTTSLETVEFSNWWPMAPIRPINMFISRDHFSFEATSKNREFSHKKSKICQHWAWASTCNNWPELLALGGQAFLDSLPAPKCSHLLTSPTCSWKKLFLTLPWWAWPVSREVARWRERGIELGFPSRWPWASSLT